MEFIIFALYAIVFVIVGFCAIYIITSLITTAILKAKEEFYVERFKKKESAARTGNER